MAAGDVRLGKRDTIELVVLHWPSGLGGLWPPGLGVRDWGLGLSVQFVAGLLMGRGVKDSFGAGGAPLSPFNPPFDGLARGLLSLW